VTSDGKVTITKDEEPGVEVTGRLEPLVGTDSSEWQFRLVDRKVTSTITGFVAAGSVKLPVSSIAGFQVGSEVVIDIDTPTEERNTIVGFGSILLETPLQFDHDAGATVTSVDNGPEYRLKTEGGMLVVGRLEESTWEDGVGTLVVSEGEAEDESSFPVVVIVVVLGVLGVLGIVAAVLLLRLRKRSSKNLPPVQPVDLASATRVTSKVEIIDVETPKLLGALQGSSSNVFKKTRSASPVEDGVKEISVEAESSDLEAGLDLAQKESYDQGKHSDSIRADLSDPMDEEEAAEHQSSNEGPLYYSNEYEEFEQFELTIASI
jgi:hypothetical protein